MPQCSRELDYVLLVVGDLQFKFFMYSLQPPAATHVKMVETAQLLALAPVTWVGRECSVKQVGPWVMQSKVIMCICLSFSLFCQYRMVIAQQ